MDSSGANQVRTSGSNTKTIIPLRDIQFMHRCHDNAYHLEYSSARDLKFIPDQSRLIVEKDHEQLLAQCFSKDIARTILIFASSIRNIITMEGDKVGLVLHLHYPPPLRECAATNHEEPSLQKILTHLTPTPFHKYVAPFTWSVIRLVFHRPEDLEMLQASSFISNVTRKVERCSISTLQHFSRRYTDPLNHWLSDNGNQLPWGVAFQCAALLYNLQLCAKNLLSLSALIQGLLKETTSTYTENVVLELSIILQQFEGQQPHCSAEHYLRRCFEKAREGVDKRSMYLDPGSSNGVDSTKCYHVNITPIGFNLYTVSLDMSNRILRMYPENQDSFLRVSFSDEQGLPLQFKGQKINKSQYVKGHIGQLMRSGFRFIRPKSRFLYLHYSHSSLRDLTFWFMRPFKSGGKDVTVDSVRTSIGLAYPGQLTRCPARFGARLSQAFTATTSSLTMEACEYEEISDVEKPISNTGTESSSDRQKLYCFTDGVGCFSPEMGLAIHRALLLKQGRIHDLTPDTALPPTPSVYQIRIGGAKGIITLNPCLPGRVIQYRPSMKKFEVPHLHVEVARSFDQPAKVRLNRPLITILFGRGVSKEVFMKLQREAIDMGEKAIKSLEDAGKFLETQNMGLSFGLPQILQTLNALSMEHSQDPTLRIHAENIRKYFKHDFMESCMNITLYHMLRNLKYKAQIPVPRGWKVVGVIDESNTLEPGQIFVPIVEDSKSVNVEGKVLIYKSPVIYPGDVQFATAVSRKDLPPNSPLLQLRDCVVFSQKGDRPLPNALSGSDLDGDIYDIIASEELFPDNHVPPLDYDPTNNNKELDGDCTVDDMIDFVLDFILNDTVGIISTNFLRIAEESGLHHKKCQRLARLHSQAVDFSKTGLPIQKNEIPYPRTKDKPDYLKPELEVDIGKIKYYRSEHPLGYLYRSIELPDPSPRIDPGNNLRIKPEKLALMNNQTRAFYEGITACLEKELRLLGVIPESSHPSTTAEITQLFNHSVDQMEYLRHAYVLALGQYQGERLSEEEILLGTILVKTFDYGKREEGIISLRKEAGHIARLIWNVLKMGQSLATAYNWNEWIKRAWSAWTFGLEIIRSSTAGNVFGLKTFMLVVLDSLFAAVKEGKDLCNLAQSQDTQIFLSPFQSGLDMGCISMESHLGHLDS